MKENKLMKIIKILLPIAVIVILLLTKPLVALILIVALLGYLAYKNLPSIYSFSGNAAYAKGDLAKAEKELEKAYKTGRAKPKFISAYGYLLLKTGKVEEAYSILSKVADSNLPQDDLMHAKSNLALVIWKKGDIDGAVNMLEEVMKNYTNTTVYGSLGYLLILKGDLDRALEFNLEAYEYNNSNAVISDNLGQTYHVRGEYEKAAEIYEKLMTSKPAFPEAYYNYGLVLEALGDHEKAVETMQMALDYKFSYLSTISKDEVENKLAELKQGLEAE